MLWRPWVVCACAAVVAVLQPSFKTRTDVVLVDFIVSDKNNQPMRGLAASDFVVKEDGKERPIVSFTAFDGGDPAVASPEAAATTPRANAAPVPVRATVLLIDDGHFTQQHVLWVKPALKELLATMSKRGGAVSMVAPWSKVSVAGLFPGDAAAFNEGIDKIVGQRFEDRSSFPISDAEAIAAANGDPQTIVRLANRYVALNLTLTMEVATALVHNRAVEVARDVRQRRDVLYGIAGLALEWLAKQPGRHSVLVVSPGFPREPGDPRYQHLVTRSMQLNAPIHFVDVRGLHGMGLQGLQYRAGMDENANTATYTWTDDAEGASMLADETGGMTVRNTNDIGKALASVVGSMSTYYIIGYEAPAHAKGGFKKISVEAKTRGLQVRARKGYYVVQ